MKYDHSDIIRPVIYGGLQEHPELTELSPVYGVFAVRNSVKDRKRPSQISEVTSFTRHK